MWETLCHLVVGPPVCSFQFTKFSLRPGPFVLIKQPAHLSPSPGRSSTRLLTASSRWKIAALRLQHWPCPAKGVSAVCWCRGMALAGQPQGEMPLPQVAPGRLATTGYPSWWQGSHQCWSGAAPSPQTLPGHQLLLWSRGPKSPETTVPGLDHKQRECSTAYALNDIVFNFLHVLYK